MTIATFFIGFALGALIMFLIIVALGARKIADWADKDTGG